MTRLAKLPVEAWDPDLRAMLAADDANELEKGSAAVMAHVPAMAKAVNGFAGGLFAATTLPRRLIELVRLRTAFHNQCRSCMAMRYQSAVADGVTEGLVCSLEKPEEAADLTAAEKAALAYVDISSTDHFSIDDATFDRLRAHFSEGAIIELGMFIAFFIGFGRLAASWDMTEALPEAYRDTSRRLAPWEQEGMLVRG